MKYEYVKGRISDAVEELCIGEGDARSRLLSANEATSSLLDRHFPTELVSDWQSIQRRMTKYGPGTNFAGENVEGAVAHTMRKIKNRTASKIAQDIFKLHKKLESEY
ncbi:hypothetical protein [Vibrio porteresiae]|uniref:Uncharacterized protein n=1 Tax=Vibrio porteresiae DSM 19223 TaxID=1123496 RepID=A0ABZ0QHD0_9VIBR|nr:hypothetical protein [Vibrio porteresiae]WPC75914.1 hypothetical protein R8Z52_23660 [Vibrio porteresiae DSM 19223]